MAWLNRGAKKFEIDETVWYKGQKYKIADHLNGKYLLWKAPGEGEIEEPIK